MRTSKSFGYPVSERGIVLPMAVTVMFVLIAFAGLAFDASFLYFYKRRMQTAADAAAIAGAQEVHRGSGGSVTVAGRKDAALNRFDHGTSGIDVAVNHPPLSGPRAGNDSFVEVIITQPKPTWFLRVLDVESATVKARAVAGLTDSDGCVYALNRDSSNANNGFFVNGTTESSFACNVFSNSNFRSVGGACVSAPGVSYSGEYSNGSSSDPNCGPDEPGHGVPVADPLANRYSLPATSPCQFTNYKVTSGSAVSLTPGVYCGGIEIGGTVPTASFAPGTYVLVNGGMKIGSSVSATGSAVTFYSTFSGNANQYGPILITTSGHVAFSAPVSGPNKALLFFQDPAVSWRANNGSTISTSSTSTFDGILYFPTTDLTYSGNSSSTNGGYTMLIGYNIKIAGSAQISADFSSLGGTNPLQMAAFAE